MPHFFWTPLSITYLITLILSCLIAAFFCHQIFQAKRTQQNFHTALRLFICLSAYSVSMIFQLLSIILHPDYRNIPLPWVAPAAVIGMAGFVLFFYHLQRPAGWGRLGGRILIGVFAVIFCIEAYVAAFRHLLLLDGVVEFREAWFDINFTIFYFTAHIFLLGYMIDALARTSGNSRLGSVLPAIAALFWWRKPLPPDVRTARIFFYVATIPFLIGLVTLGRSYGVLDWRTTELLDAWFVTLAVCSFTLAYLNYIPEYSSFRVKLVGASLTTVLLIMSVVSWLTGPAFVESYRNDHQITQGTAIRFTPQENGAYEAGRRAYRFQADIGEKLDDIYEPVDIPFAFPFFGEHFSALYLTYSGMVGFEQTPLWRDVQHRFGPQPAIFANAVELTEADGDPYRTGVFMHAQDDSVVVTWNSLVSALKPDEAYTFQLRLYQTGIIEFVYSEVPQSPYNDVYLAHSAPMMVGIVPGWSGRQVADVQFFTDGPFTGAPGEGLIEHFRLEFLVFLNRIYMPIAMFSLVASLLVLIIFPYFFNVNLDRPLQKLLVGVQQIIGGKLGTSIEISHHDEIGYLAESFNQMSKAQYELNQTLEAKVVARTAEASLYAENNARLEERNRISQELHDAVSQTLFSSNLITDTVSELMKKDPQLAYKAMEEVRLLNKNALLEMRNLLLELRGKKMSNNSFARLLGEVVEAAEQTFSIQVTMQIESDTTLPDGVQLTFYRIAQECLANSAKHANASEISVYFDGIPSQAMLSVHDNGRGFLEDQVAPGSFGLQIMKERMKKIGGTLEIETSPGKGTTTTAIWHENDDS